MIQNLLEALKKRTGIQGWTLRHEVSRQEQLYAIPQGIESNRKVASQRFLLDVLRTSPGPDGNITSGSGNVTLLPGDDIEAAIDQAALIASLVHNPPYKLPGSAEAAQVPLADPVLQDNPAGVLAGLYERLNQASKQHPGVRMTAAEFFAVETGTHLWNSEGIDLQQVDTSLAIEWVLISQQGSEEMESFIELTRRRASDYDLEGEMERQARYAMDALQAAPPAAGTGPVVMTGRTLGTFLASGVIQSMASANSKYNNVTTWETGKSVFKGDVIGDPFNAWANRQLPYGLYSSRFDEEGLPGQRVPLIQANTLANFTASQRYAQYLGIPATGDFGNLEVAPGNIPEASLLTEPYTEIAGFSWFNPDTLTGDFSCEIRLGYRVEGGKRTPFKGGQLVGNVMDAIANVHWSRETGFFGDYLGPRTARFEGMQIAA